ncbi:hypothetical protein PIB30_063742 [Stylosanthes scabra]|uniref:Uncharacterized protein n=1 Tax=Stylosanthes scabra TaxID=79078 RepID=A0ABU6QM41_9FABA|nr:hypothetical protein [Stylosanthes scabra]
MQRLRQRGSTMASLSAANLKRKALNSWAAVNDTFFLTKDAFERHRVVFTVGTSIASVATAWIGYSLRHLHEEKVDRRLESIEKAMRNKHNLDHSEIKDIVGPGGISVPACAATAATTLIIGYGLGWRGGSWYAMKKFRKEQMKMLGQIKPRRWELLGKIKPRGLKFQFLRRPLIRPKVPDTSANTSETIIKNASSKVPDAAAKTSETTVKNASSTRTSGSV